MTEDRRNLLLSVWEQMYLRRCRCGRCDCIDSDPVQIASRVLFHWSAQYQSLAVSAANAAKWRRELAKRWLDSAKRRKPGALTRAELVASATEAGAPLLAEAEREEAKERRWARAAVRCERLARGLHPFRAHEKEDGRR